MNKRLSGVIIVGLLVVCNCIGIGLYRINKSPPIAASENEIIDVEIEPEILYEHTSVQTSSETTTGETTTSNETTTTVTTTTAKPTTTNTTVTKTPTRVTNKKTKATSASKLAVVTSRSTNSTKKITIVDTTKKTNTIKILPAATVIENRITSDGIVTLDKGFDQYSAHVALSRIPDNIWDALVDDDWNIIFTNKEIEHLYVDYEANPHLKGLSLAGLITYDEKRIVVENATILLHEIGHFIDCKSGWLRNSDEFKAIYESEKAAFRKNVVMADYFVASSSEYFAESYQQIMKNPEKMKKFCPKTYEYILKASKML